jgi:hypothetical protein
MGLIAPQDQGYVGGLTKLRFDQQVSRLNLSMNGVRFHAEEGDGGPAECFTIDMNGIPPGTQLNLLEYLNGNGTVSTDSIIVYLGYPVRWRCHSM